MIKYLSMLRMLGVLRICGHLSDRFQEFWLFLTASVFLNILIIIDIYMTELGITERCNQNHILKTYLINYLNKYSSYPTG